MRRRASRPFLSLAFLVVAAPGPAGPQALFEDDFENGLARWEITGDGVSIVATGDPGHGRVMQLDPHGDALAVVRGSDAWPGARVEFDVLFPTDVDNYLGMAYAVTQREDRLDFGLVYIKGNDSYLRVNPHRDFNVGRTLYEEYRTPLTGVAAIRTGEWQRAAFEVIGSVVHVYIGDMTEPQLTFSALELNGGGIGFQPRSVGGSVRIDNVRVAARARFSWTGPPKPDPDYSADSLATDWQVAGPFERTRDDLARRPADFEREWRPFATDARGAVITASVVDYHGPRTVAYFRTQVRSTGGPATLHLSTVDDLALWVNGRFHWFIPRGGLAWYDFWRNEAHAGSRIPVSLEPGTNDIVLRVRGGVYATGGFFARFEPAEPPG
jgi:hypothetical protein